MIMTQPGPYTSSTLLNGRIAYWHLDEASGVALDSGPNGLTLTDNNTVGAAAGQINGARLFVAAQSESLSRANESLLQTGDIIYTFALWAKLTSKATRQTLLWKGVGGAPTLDEYFLDYSNSSDRFRFVVGGNAYTVATANVLGSPTIATWYYIVVAHNSTANTATIQINGGTADSASTGANTPPATAGAFRVGAYNSSLYMDGAIDNVQFWKRLLTAPEIAEDYANGIAGRES